MTHEEDRDYSEDRSPTYPSYPHQNTELPHNEDRYSSTSGHIPPGSINGSPYPTGKSIEDLTNGYQLHSVTRNLLSPLCIVHSSVDQLKIV
jgi:hypothetical protein